MNTRTIKNVYAKFFSAGHVVYTRLVLEMTVHHEDNWEEFIINLETEKNFSYDAIELVTNGRSIYRKSFLYLRPAYRAGIKEIIKLETKINRDLEKGKPL